MTLPQLLVRAAPRRLLLATLGSLASGLLTTSLVALAALAARDPRHAGSSHRYAALCIALFAVELGARRLVAGIGHQAVFALRMDLARRLLVAPLRQLEEIGAPRVFAAASENAFELSAAITHLPGILAQSTLVIACLAYCVVVWPVGGGAMAALLVGITALTRVVQRRGMRRLFALRGTEGEVFGGFKALVDGAKELKLHAARRATFEELFGQASAALRDGNARAMSLLHVAGVWGSISVFALIGGALFVLPHLAARPSSDVIGRLVIAFLFVIPALNYVLVFSNMIGHANVALRKLEALGLELPTGRPPAAAAPLGFRRLALRGVTRSYHREADGALFRLGPIDLDLAPGELVFVTGGNGSGKSTLGKLVTGLYAPEDGAVALDDEPITDEGRARQRALFAAVFSDFHLFDRLLGVGLADLDARARGYLERLALHHKVTVSRGALSTTELSQGQRKRLALLTAYLDDRPIYLFDEWAADQDPEFKAVFYQELLPELRARGKCVVAITHDDAYFHLADRILKLDEGQIVDERRPTSR